MDNSLNIGKFVFDTTEKVNIQVLEKIEVSMCLIRYTIRRRGNSVQYDENYLRYVTLLSKIKNDTAGGLLSSIASGIIPHPPISCTY